MQALRQVARRPRTSFGRGRSTTSQNKRRRRRDPTPHQAGTYALTTAQRVGPTTIRTRRVRGRCVPTASGWGTPRENVSGTSSPNKGTSSDGALLRWRRCAIGGDRRWAVRAHARGWLSSILQSRRCVYPVGVIDGGLPSRVMSELAPITLERDVVTSDLPDIMLAVHVCFFCKFLSFFSPHHVYSEIRWIAQRGVHAWRENGGKCGCLSRPTRYCPRLRRSGRPRRFARGPRSRRCHETS